MKLNLSNLTMMRYLGSIVQSSCHASGAANGDFTTFETLQEDLDNEKFANRVLVSKDMPPQYAPEGHPKSLDDAEIMIIQCWADGGYQNN